MKKSLMLVAGMAALCSMTVSAQKVNLPEKGTVSTEIQFNPFTNDFKTFQLDALKLRYFMTDKDALRLSVGLNFDKKNDVTPLTEPDEDATQLEKDLYNYQNDNNENTAKNGLFKLGLGYERHFVKSGRIDLYAGAEIGIGLGWAKTKIVEGAYEGREGMYFDSENSRTYNLYTKETETKGAGKGSYFALNASVFTGIDFYIYKGLYVGAELGLNINNKAYKDYEETTTNNSALLPDKDRTTTVIKKDNRSDMDMKLNVTPALRLGWTF